MNKYIYIDADLLRKEIKRIMSRAMNEEGQDVCNYILSIINSSQKYSLPEWEEHPEATNNIAMVWNDAATPWLDWRGHRISVRSLEKLPGFDSLQQEQPCDTCTNDKGCVTCKDGELWEGKEQPCEDLEEVAEEWAENEAYGKSDAEFEMAYKGFIAGAEWQKEQMMEDAVEGKIEEVSFNNGELHNTIFFSFNEESLHVENRIWFPRCGKEGDKVKIVIVPIKED